MQNTFKKHMQMQTKVQMQMQEHMQLQDKFLEVELRKQRLYTGNFGRERLN